MCIIYIYIYLFVYIKKRWLNILEKYDNVIDIMNYTLLSVLTIQVTNTSVL